MLMPPTNPRRRPAPGFGSSRTFPEKLGIYLVGVTIGLLVLGWFQWRKMQATPPPPADAAASGDPAPANPPGPAG